MNFLEQLNDLVNLWWPLARVAWKPFQPFDIPTISTNISELDARSFIRGLTGQPAVFRVDDGYKVYSRLLPPLKDGSEKQFDLMEIVGRKPKQWVSLTMEGRPRATNARPSH